MIAKPKIIGVFDSGIGGLTVLKELVKLLPSHSFIYFADTGNCPYGPKGKDEIIRLSSQITDFLIAKECSSIVVACNTATASAIDYLRDNYKLPFIGMEPAIKPAALATKTNSIGVLATEGTFKGRLYRETTSKYASSINVSYQIGEGLVELIEMGKSNSLEARSLLLKYIEPMLNDNIDHLVLGCTHYPFFTSLLKGILPSNITIIDPAPAVARQTVRVLANQASNCAQNETSVLSEAYTHFYTSGNIDVLKRMVNEAELSCDLSFPNKQFFEKKL